MIGTLGAGLVAGLGVAMPVGAIGVFLLGLPARAGRRVSIAAALGVATTDGLYATVAVLGGASLAAPLRHVEEPLRFVSAAVLGVLAVLTLLAARRATGAQRGIRLTPLRAFVGLLGLTAVNPATLAYFLALVLGTDGSLRHSGALWFVLGVAAASAAWQLALVGGGSALAAVISTPRGRLGMAIVSAAVMLGLAVKVALGN